MNLSNLKPPMGARRNKKRIARGGARGGTSGRGNKGQQSRTGYHAKAGFEGGQMPLQRRLPKRGFFNPFRREYVIVHVGDLERFEANGVVDGTGLAAAGLVHKAHDRIKIVGDGELSKPLTVRVQGFTQSAKQKIETVGGKAEVVADIRKSMKQEG